MRKITLLLMTLLFCSASILWAQQTVSGTVVSAEDNQGIPGVSIVVKGSSPVVGVSTDINGQYSVQVPANHNTLVFSFTGMKTQEITIDGKSSIDVTMGSGALDLDAVVVTGYGVSRKAAFTGASTTVSDEVIKARTSANVVASLQGNIPGLQVTTGSSQPGSASTVRLRGVGSLNASSTPLYVVDGIPISTESTSSIDNEDRTFDPMSVLNPNDIESISVLKDASATAIYGARASNGVIVINTKKGVVGKNKFDVSIKKGVNMAPRVPRRMQMMNADDYITLAKEGWKNLHPDWTDADIYAELRKATRSYGDGSPVVETAVINDYYLNGGYTNWWDEVTQPGAITEVNLSASGANDNAKYYTSAGYSQNDYYVIGSAFQRYSLRTNVEFKGSNWLTYGANVSLSYIYQQSVNEGTGYSSPLYAAKRLRPTDAVKNEDGTWNLHTSLNFSTTRNIGFNPVAINTLPDGDDYHNKIYKGTVAPFIRLQLYKNIVFQTKASEDFTYTDQYFSYSPYYSEGFDRGIVTKYAKHYIINNITNTLNWLPSVGKHHFNVLVGQEAQKRESEYTYMYQSELPDPYQIRQGIGDDKSEGASYIAYASILSVFTNVEYELGNKYYLSGSLRRDGSSRFGTNQKWGNFWSVGGKWRVSHEEFMKPTAQWLDNMTLRISYGKTGNQDIGWYESLGTYGNVTYGALTGIAPSAIGNPDLHWESKNKFDVGFEVSVLNRVTFEVDYYNEKTFDLLYATPISLITGETSITTNFASLNNSGVEVQANLLLYKAKDVQWTFGFNFAHNKTTILDLGEDSIISSYYARFKDHDYRTFYVQQWGGVDPQTGRGYWLNPNGTREDVYANVEKTNLGCSDPTIYGGFNTRVNAYGFDLSANFYYSVGRRFFSNEAYRWENVVTNSASYYNTSYYYFDNRWQKPGDNALAPSFVHNSNSAEYGISSRFITKGDYLRLQNLAIGYTLPSAVVKKAKLDRVRVYLSFDNIWTWYNKDCRDLEPEGSLSMSNSFTYPSGRNMLAGLQLTF